MPVASRLSASGSRSLFLAGIVLAERRHDADRDPALPQLRAQPDAPRPPARVGRASRSSTRAGSRRTSPPGAASRAGAPTFARADARARRPATRSTSTAPSARSRARTRACRGSTSQKIDWTSGETLTFVVHAAGLDGAYYAVANPVEVGHATIGAIVVAKQKTAINQFADSLVRRLAIAFGVRAPRRGRLRVVRVAPARRPAAPPLARDRRGRGRELRRRACRCRAPGEIGHLAERFEEMAQRLHGVGGARAELPDVGLARAAHAAHGDPRPRRRRSRRGSSTTRGPSALARDRRGRGGRLERLVGDILDLAKLERAPLHGAARGGRDGAGRRARLRDVRRAGPVALDRLLGGREGAAGDRLRRRPRAADRRQPALERVPRDARRRPDRARARPGERHGLVAVEDNGPGIAPDDRERLFRPFVSGRAARGSA